MEEYISRKWLLDEYDRLHVGPPGGARKMIETAPAANVAPVVYGRWEEWLPPKHMILTGEEVLYRCFACDAKYSDIEGFRCCPYCGARMRKDGDGNS